MTDSTASAGYAPGTHPDLPPPKRTTGVVGWAYQNLLSSPLNIALTVFGVYLLYLIVPPMVEWVFLKSIWTAESRVECWAKMSVPEEAACWAFIKGRLNLFIYGFYPVAAVRFRASLSEPMDAVYMLMAIGVGLAAGTQLTTVAYLASVIFVVITLGVWKSNFGAKPAVLSGWSIVPPEVLALAPETPAKPKAAKKHRDAT